MSAHPEYIRDTSPSSEPKEEDASKRPSMSPEVVLEVSEAERAAQILRESLI